MKKMLLNPIRVRRITGSFAFIEHRFLRDGFLASLDADELALYVFFVLAADEKGLSYYNSTKICRLLSLNPLDYEGLLGSLARRDLIAYASSDLVQVLSLPELPILWKDASLREEGVC